MSLAHLSMISVPPVGVVRAGAEAGFDAVGLRLVPTSHGVDHGTLGNPRALADIRRAIDESGIGVLDVEVFRVRDPAAMTSPSPLVDAAAQLGARYVITTLEDLDESRCVDSFGRLCADARRAGVGIALEFMVFSAAPDLGAALRVLEQVGAPNAVLLVDALHHERSGGRPGDLAEVDLALLPYLQVCDAPTAGPQPDASLARAEAVKARLLPGDGVLPLADLVAATPPTTMLSVESPLSWPDASTDPLSVARRARASVDHLARPSAFRRVHKE